MLYFVEYVFILSIPVVCLIGIATNLIVFTVVVHKSNRQHLKENQYNYMTLNSLLNSFILLIEIFLLMSECQGDYGLFCSSIRTWKFSQYFKIIFGEYVSNSLRLLSNFTYVGFTINRLSLIGKKQGKFVKNVSKLTICQFIRRTVWPCLALPVVKIFRFIPNTLLPDQDYPNPIAFYFTKISSPLIFVYLSFNILFDLVNYFVFLLVNFVIDVKLVITLKKVIDEKQKNKSRIVCLLKKESRYLI